VVNRGNVWVRNGRMANSVVATLACALVALLLPALAGAEMFDVNTAGDAPNAAVGAVCDTGAPAAENCSLRAAIEAADADPAAAADEIHFQPNVFKGRMGVDEINLATPLPPIIHPLAIEGGVQLGIGACGAPPLFRPCVGVSAPAAAAALRIEAPGVTVEDMAIGGGRAGIEVLGGSTGFAAKGDWFGLKLNAEVNGSDTAGILLGPGSDGAVIGAEEEEETNRNVFGNSSVGIEIEGASDTKILGNYIGVDPEGDGPATLEIGVRIVDGPVTPAQHNEVGGKLSPDQAASTICDGACNVIATDAGTGIDLAGNTTEPATGPTHISGNFLGLEADGTTPVGDNEWGVYAAPTFFACGGGPAEVTVGGSAPTETNYIEGGGYGIYAEGAENFSALGNAIGIAADATASESPVQAGISVCAEGVTQEAHISGNEMNLGLEYTVGIESGYGKAEITGNSITGSEIGIRTEGESESDGDLIQGNTVTGPELDGIFAANKDNTLTGNAIHSAGRGGIELDEAHHNRVGGDLAGEENSIDGSGVGAILVSGPEETRDEVAGNIGAGNAGAFIQLLEDESGERPNGGVKPPAFATTLQSSATGTAPPDATVRVFRKASAEAGELASLLAVEKADSAGNWKATFATVPVGTLVAATQTSGAGNPAGGTSEVSAPIAAAADPVVPVEPGGGGSGGGSSGPGSSTLAPAPTPPKTPKVKITKGPAKRSKSTTAKFKFTATPTAGAKFECKLDAAKWVRCISSKTYKRLKPRKHTFQVRAFVAGAPASKPLKFQFTVKP
jgi:hypothetical protein